MVDEDGAMPAAAEDESFYRRIGQAVRAIRRREGMTLATLSASSGMSPSFLSQMERGLVRASYLSLNRVAKALGTTVQELMTSGAAGRAAGSRRCRRSRQPSPPAPCTGRVRPSGSAP